MRQSITTPKLRRRTKMQVEVLEDRRLLATITVNTTADDTTADATLSLREAIEVSDGTLAVSSLSTQEEAQVSGAIASPNTIQFDIPQTDPGYDPATGAWTIAVHSELPAISTNAASINGYTQPGASFNASAQGDNAKITIAISGAGQGTINGLTIDQPGTTVFGLDIEDFGGDGVLIAGAGGAQVAGCFIGTDPTGEEAAPNATGVVVESSSNTIGGAGYTDRDVISGNSAPGLGDGLYIPDQADNPLNLTPTMNVIQENFIGLDAAGTKALGNGQAGVADFGSGNTYGGLAFEVGNVISGNAADGIKSNGSITIESNDIGTDGAVTAAIGNGPGGSGIVAGGPSGAAISVTIEDNVVSGNAQSGIALSPGSPSQSTFTVDDNKIGTDVNGFTALGNGQAGLLLTGVENATVDGNEIAGNRDGIDLIGSGPDVQHDVFQSNLIGTNQSGDSGLGNTVYGMNLSNAIGNTIGGTGQGQGNLIALNGSDAIHVAGGQQDRITQNLIYENAGAGITLISGGNLSTPAPVMTLTPSGISVDMLSGTLIASPNLTYTVEIFSNTSAPAAGHEQGQKFVQDATVTTDASGKGTFSVNPLIDTYSYTATATDPAGNTSAFALATLATPTLPASVTAVSSSANPSTAGQSVTFTAVVTASGYLGTPTGTVTFTIDGQAQTPVALSIVGSVDEAQFTTSTLAAGPHTVSAAYGGESGAVAASSGSLTQTVNAPSLPTTTNSLASSSNPSTVGQQVTFTAVVSPGTPGGTPTGAVTFTIDGTAEAPVPLQVVGGIDEAVFSTSTLTVGTHTIGAAYNGDTTFDGSTVTNPLTQTVNPLAQTNNPLATSTTVVSSRNPSVVGETVTFTATVAPTTATGTPTGTVTFTIDGKAEAPVPLRVVDGKDQAAFSIATLTASTHTISVEYDGDATFAASTVSRPLTQTVMPATQPTTTSTQTVMPATQPTTTSTRTPTTSTQTANTPTVDPPVVMSLKRYGIHMQPTVLVLKFSEAMDPIRAQDVRNYQISGPTGRPVGIDSAVYDPAANTVTLKPRSRIDLHHTYHVKVIGTGTGGDGKAGSNYFTTLNWRNVVLTPAEAKRWLPKKPAIPSRAPGLGFVSRSR
jgi:CSLREA domain-containing protein